MKPEISMNENNQNIPETLVNHARETEILFFQEIVRLLQSGLRSEEPKDYGLDNAKNLDLFSWEMVEDAKKSNIRIRFAIEKIEEKMLGLKQFQPPINPPAYNVNL